MRQILIIKSDAAPPDGCTPTTGAPPGYQAWTREVEDTATNDAPKRAPGKPRTILDAVEMMLSGLESQISAETPAMVLPFDVNAPTIQADTRSLDEMPPLAPALIRKIFAALRNAEIYDLAPPEDLNAATALDALAAEDRRRVLIHLKRLLGATITIDGQKEQPDALADGLAVLAMIAAPAVKAQEQILAERLTAAIVERDAIRLLLAEMITTPHPPKKPEKRKIGSMHLGDREAYERTWKTYTERMAAYKIEREATLLQWANALAQIVGRIEKIRHHQRTASPISWALDLAIQIGVQDPATGTLIGTTRDVRRDDAAILDAIAAAVVPDASRESERATRATLREMMQEHRGDILSLVDEVFAPYTSSDLTDANLRKRVERSLAALTATPKDPDEAERLRWYRARGARLGALLWPPPSPDLIKAEKIAARARILRHEPAASRPKARPEPSEWSEVETLEPEGLGVEDAAAIAILREMNF